MMNKLLIFIFISMTTLNVSCQEASPLHYVIKEPKTKSSNPPLLILLHGVGSNEEDLFSLAPALPENYLIVSARAPIALSPNSYAWYQVDFSTGKPIYNFDQQEKSRNTLIQFIEFIKKEKGISSNEIYLCGFSQGAIMSYNIALTRPDLINGAALMSGRLIEEIKPFAVHKDRLQHLKLFISHGTNDNVLPIDYARKANHYFISLGIHPLYKEYTVVHTINQDMLTDLSNWLKAQK
jgi:phospholipase/carboxylesterase